MEELSSTLQIPRAQVRVRRPGLLRLQVVEVGGGGSIHEIDGPRLQAGRSHLADVVLEHESVSKLHFALELDGGRVVLRDLGSTNGTWYAGRRVEAMVLEPGDEFLAGACRLRLHEVGEVEVDALEGEHFGALHGGSLPMRELYARIAALAPTALDMLLLGETGTGKELIARTIHALSPRARGPFVILDCGALSPTLAEATMFGFSRGAFAGAERDSPGPFEEGRGGTVFIDEIGDLPRDMQVKLLGVLERREITRLGEPGQSRPIDVRVIAATNQDLRQAASVGSFREDLYYRLSCGVLEAPPLRDRGEDTLALADLFLRKTCHEHDLQVELSPEARRALTRHGWPGNIRELRNVIERAVHIKRAGVVSGEDLLIRPGRKVSPSSLEALAASGRSYEEMHREVDQVALPVVIERFAGNISHMAAHLQISRDRLRARLKELGLYSR